MKKDKDIIPNTLYLSSKLSKEPGIRKEYIRITDKILNSWQKIVDTIAEIINIPSALIMKVNHPYIEVFSSNISNNNPYKAGDREHLTGLYCEEVIKKKEKLLVPNAMKDKKWNKNPDIKLGMISYLGFPILWPDGEAFGTICVLDSKENRYGKRYEELMLMFKELAEFHLALLFQDFSDKKNLENILNNLTEGIIAHDKQRRILFFNRAAEKITGYRREEVLGKDCHEAFGGPFCGGRCSFQQGPPDSLEHLYYPLNILTKEGQPRRLEMSVSGTNDNTGAFVGVIASFRDLTEMIGLKTQVGDLTGFAGIIGRDPKMLKIYRQIRDMATNDYPVHISGETGTGKELVAAGIHNESRRGGMPFVPINCGALPEGVLESELFGHVKGAFTGAIRDKKGRFELANGGTLFLDEVSDLPLVVQAKLLRVIQEGTFEPVGGEKTVSVNVRLISAANRNLKHEVEKGNFRDDLYYRVNVVPIHLPPLRERKNDIPILAEHFLKEFLKEGQKTLGLSKEALAIMISYQWPGNVRELQSAIRFALIKARGRIIQPDNLPMELQEWKHSRSSRGPSRKLDPESVQEALNRSGGNKAKAARLLGVGRATLYRFLADFPDVS
ncbi:MAG TPA: sigma-54-dependent Fis family transcriptional regulator [Desulfobacteraceae bacterium]|nr:sigma-54-dependent Fis family transcriptional regulator [Desulfobacteraceae bacterium]